jgi:hypothetical protein
MLRLFFSALFFGLSVSAMAQQYSMALGLHTGMTVPYSYDQGINKDPRYQERYSAKLAPIGVMFSVDFEGIGFLTNPGIITLGTDYSIVNTDGGHDGRRKINLTYLQVPVGVKIHIIDLSFFRVSGVASFSAAYLMNSSDKITHTSTKLIFPDETILPPGYVREFDGVLVPAIKEQTVIRKKDYNSLQFFAGLGIRTDWDVSNVWRVSFDFRVNYGLTDPRSKDYMARVDKYETLYDTPGKRNEMFAHLNIGIARYIDWDQHDQSRKKNQGVKHFPGKKRRR